MLRSLRQTKGAEVEAADGDAGTVEGFLLDDERWVVRYLTVNTGDWLAGRRVLVSPVALRPPDDRDGGLYATITREQIAQLPELDLNEPITRGAERGYFRFFAWPLYWTGGTGYWGGGNIPGMLIAPPGMMDAGIDPTVTEVEEPDDEQSRLRDADSFRSYAVQGAAGADSKPESVGEVDDFVIDDATWAVRYIAVYDGNLLGGRRVLVPVEAFDQNSWADARVNAAVTKRQIESAPDWQPLEPITPDYEQRVRSHFSAPEPAPG